MSERGEYEPQGDPLCVAVELLRRAPLETTEDENGFLTFFVAPQCVRPAYEQLVQGSWHDLLLPPGATVGQVFINNVTPRLDSMRIKPDPDWMAVKYRLGAAPGLFVTLGYDYAFPDHTASVLVAVGAETLRDRSLVAGREAVVQARDYFIAPLINNEQRPGCAADTQALLAVTRELVNRPPTTAKL